MEARVASKMSSFAGKTVVPAKAAKPAAQRGSLQVVAGMKEIRDRIGSIKNTQKITEAMKLVAAAKVRRAQEAVINGRPFSENLIKAMYGVNQRLRVEDVDSPLCEVRPVKTVLLVVLTGDRGLCGGYNNFIIKKTEQRYAQLKALGVDVQLVTVGSKGRQYFQRRPQYTINKSFSLGQTPTTKDAQAVADEIFSSFVSAEVDKVELVFTKFVSLISSSPSIQTMLPLTPQGEICDVEGNCIDVNDDEIFRLTTKDGQLSIERERVSVETPAFDASLIFEQDPVQILDALLPQLCKSHGGGKRCMHEGGGVCPKSVHGGTEYCVAHGGGKRCSVAGCTKSARGRTDCCVRHGGGKRCKVQGCEKSAQGSTDFCKAHGGGKRCGWAQGCDKFARGRSGLCAAHGNAVAAAKSGMIRPGLFSGVVAAAAAATATATNTTTTSSGENGDGWSSSAASALSDCAESGHRRHQMMMMMPPQVLVPQGMRALPALPEGRVHGGGLMSLLGGDLKNAAAQGGAAVAGSPP